MSVANLGLLLCCPIPPRGEIATNSHPATNGDSLLFTAFIALSFRAKAAERCCRQGGPQTSSCLLFSHVRSMTMVLSRPFRAIFFCWKRIMQQIPLLAAQTNRYYRAHFGPFSSAGGGSCGRYRYLQHRLPARWSFTWMPVALIRRPIWNVSVFPARLSLPGAGLRRSKSTIFFMTSCNGKDARARSSRRFPHSTSMIWGPSQSP